MKFYKIIIFVSLILAIESVICGIEVKASSVKECNENFDKSNSNPYCCYIKGKDKNKNKIKGCISLSQYQYDHIKDVIKSYKDQGDKIKKIDCKSIYLGLSILRFIFLLL